MRNIRCIAKGQIRTPRSSYQVVGLFLSAIAGGAATLSASSLLRGRSGTYPPALAQAVQQPVFEQIAGRPDSTRIAVDRESYCRQLAIESLLTLRPDFSRQSITISRDTNRPGEVIEQFAETLGEAFERVWMAAESDVSGPTHRQMSEGDPE